MYAQWLPGFIGGESENLLGRWLKDRGKRDDLFIATKVGFPVPAQELDFGQTAEQIERGCEGSLKRMGIDHIDLFYVHFDHRHVPVEERLEAFDRLVRAGKVRYIGASNTVAWRLEEARKISQMNGWAQFCCIQQWYSYVRPRAGVVYDPHAFCNNELLDYCLTTGVSLMAYSPLMSGAYTRADRSFPEEFQGEDTDARVATLRKVASEVGYTENQVVLAWMLRSQPYTIPLVGASKREQLAENLKALEVPLTVEKLEELSQAHNVVQKQPPRRQRPKIAGMKEG